MVGLFVFLVICSQIVIGGGFSRFDSFSEQLYLIDIPGPYCFESLCLTVGEVLWTAGGGGEVHRRNLKTDTTEVYKLENEHLFNGDFYGIFVNEEGKGWVVGDNGVIFHTPDNGKTWQLQESNLKGDRNLETVTCIDNNCWAVGEDGTVLSSIQGGKWKSVDINADEESLADVFFINKNIGWIVGRHGGIWKTTDSGNTWSFQELRIGEKLAPSLSIKFHNEQNGWISGFDFVARTEDGGKTWKTIEIDGQFIGIVTKDGKKVWAIQRGGNYCSIDAGKTWNRCCIDMK